MNPVGNPEKVLVFGILLVLALITFVAIKSATKLEPDLETLRREVVKASDDTELPEIASLGDQAEPGPLDRGSLGRPDPAERANESSSTISDLLDQMTGKVSDPGAATTGPEELAPTRTDTSAEPPPKEPQDPPTGAARDPAGSVRESGGLRAPAVQDEKQEPAEPARGPEAQRTPRGLTYVVQPGDTIMGMARVLYDDRSMFPKIEAANPGVDPQNLLPGTVLTLPKAPLPERAWLLKKTLSKTKAPEARVPDVLRRTSSAVSYRVKKGDTLMAIARTHYGTPLAWTLIRDNNRSVIIGKDGIREGQTLRLPAEGRRD